MSNMDNTTTNENDRQPLVRSDDLSEQQEQQAQQNNNSAYIQNDNDATNDDDDDAGMPSISELYPVEHSTASHQLTSSQAVSNQEKNHEDPTQETTESREEEVDDDVSTSQVTSSCCRTCVTSCLGSRPVEQKRLLVLNLVLLAWTLGVAGLSLGEIKMNAHGQCILGMPLYEGGLDPREVKMFYCKCPIYTLLLTGCVTWLSLMVNWVSDLHSKRAVFYKWLKWQAALTFMATVGIIGSLLLALYGFVSWCGRLHDQLAANDGPSFGYSSTSPSPVRPRIMCFQNAIKFDNDHKDDNQMVELKKTFIFSLLITILLSVHMLLWMAAFYYTVRMLKIEPKSNFDINAYQQALAQARPIYPTMQAPAGEADTQGTLVPYTTDQIDPGAAGADASNSPPSTNSATDDEGFKSCSSTGPVT